MLNRLARLIQIVVIFIFAQVMSQMVTPNMFIEHGVLDLIPLDSYKPPMTQSTCANGAIYAWEPVNESMPYTNFYINDIAYAIQANNRCQLCVCTEDNQCYTPKNNYSYNLNFIPYCTDISCYMYGVIYQQPFFAEDTLIGPNGQDFQSPLPYLETLSETSNYLKVSSISCNGCSNLSLPLNCGQSQKYEKNNTNYLKTDFPPAFSTNDDVVIAISYVIVTVISDILYIMVMYVILKSPELWKFDAYKLMFHLGIFTIADAWIRIFYVFTWNFWFGPMTIRFVIAGLNYTSISITILTFALALNRWEALASPRRFLFIQPMVYYLLRALTAFTYLFGLSMFICQCLPGYGRFSIHIKTENRTQVISKREYKGLDLLYFCADIEQAFMLASMFLYIWVTISVIYQRIVAIHKVSRKEFLLFIQTLTPCLARISANALTMVFTSPEPWFLAVVSSLWQFESCHYPFLYIALNT